MSTPEVERTLIDEIDDRQDELLKQLSELNSRVEALLHSCLQARDEDRADERQDNGAFIPGGPNGQTFRSPESSANPQEC